MSVSQIATDRLMPTSMVCVWFLAFIVSQPIAAIATQQPRQEFLDRLAEVPFCYLAGDQRSWQILRYPLSNGDRISLSARVGRDVIHGSDINITGVNVSVTEDGKLLVDARNECTRPGFELNVNVQLSCGRSITQSLEVRAAPPVRPISYIADLVDDLIHTFADPATGTFRTVDREGFDQYFRRLQAQGISSLIVWFSPFPFITDAADHRTADWDLYAGQARAIIESHHGLLGQDMARPEDKMPTAFHFALKQTKLASSTWVAQILALRLDSTWGEMFTESAAEHGIKLVASFRPFESAVTKFHEIPAFEGDGTYLWGFLPLATPMANYHADEVGFAHYRTILSNLGNTEAAEPSSLELRGVKNAVELARQFNLGRSSLQILASKYPPIDEDSLVLVRSSSGRFGLRHFREISRAASDKRLKLRELTLEASSENSLRITGISMPDGFRYLLLINSSKIDDCVTATNVSVQSRAETPIGRLNWYWSLSNEVDPSHSTQVSGITEHGEFRSMFQATSSSIELLRGSPPRERVAGATLVIDLGRPWEGEMLDFERPAARQLAITQLRRLLAFPAFEGIFINTRTHTQLPGCMGDGADGVRPQREYIAKDKPFFHMGIDRAYAPRSLANNQRIQQLAAAKETTAVITNWQAGEWQGPCESDDSPYAWRLERKRATASGIRQLLQDIEHEFPDVRVRVVVPPSDSTVEAVRFDLERLPKEGGGVYGRDYYDNIWASINHIPAVGESMSMTDFSGLSVEPVFLGVRLTPDDPPLNCYLNHSFRDLADNRGSSFHGPRSFFYEAQETLRGTEDNQARLRKRREEIICKLLSYREDVNEVLLYEAADWAYMLPLSNPEICGHNFLDRCHESNSAHEIRELK